jgi:VWFA-related protein
MQPVARAAFARPGGRPAQGWFRVSGAASLGIALALTVGGAQAPAAQAPAPPAAGQPAQQEQPVFRTSTRLIITHVTVRDAEGRPIEGLTASDFVITEDGQRMDIAFVDYQRIANELVTELPDTPAPAAAAAPAAAPAGAATGTTAVDIATPPPGSIQYQNRRLLVLYFDQASMPLADQLRSYENARRFLDTRMTVSDLVAVMTFSNSTLRVRQDFTDNRAALREVIDTLQVGDDLNADGLPDTGADGDSEFSVFNTNQQLSALQDAVGRLRALPEQKTLVYFGSGLRINSDNQAQIRATTNAANRANVTINPVDARGLTASAPQGDATQAARGGAGQLFGGTQVAATSQAAQDTLFALARDTGGTATFDSNDLALGIVRAAQTVGDHYIVAYYSTRTATDGRFRQVRVEVPSNRTARVTHRPGYFGEKSFANFTAADKERQLEEAFRLEDPITEITIAMELNYFQLSRAEYYVPVSMKIPGSELSLARRRGAPTTSIDFIGEIRDEYGTVIQNIRDSISIRLSDADAEQLTRRPIQYENGYVLLPGKYVIKLLARDATTGRIGTFQTAFVVPNLVRETQQAPISSVVLGSQRVPVGSELFTVRQDADVAALNPLVVDGQRLVPSVTRVFSRSRDLLVYLEAYQRDTTAAAMRPLVAVVSLYRGDEKVLETAPLPVVGGMHTKSKAVPLMFSVPLGDTAPGRYECQVMVLDAEKQTAAFWRMPLAVVP